MLSTNKILLSFFVGQLLSSGQVFSMPDDDDKGKALAIRSKKAAVRTKAIIVAPDQELSQFFDAQAANRDAQHAQASNLIALFSEKDVTSVKKVTLEGDTMIIKSSISSDTGKTARHHRSKNLTGQSHHIEAGASEESSHTSGGGGFSLPGISIGGHGADSHHRSQGANINRGSNHASNEAESHENDVWDKIETSRKLKFIKGNTTVEGMEFGNKKRIKDQISSQSEKIKVKKNNSSESRRVTRSSIQENNNTFQTSNNLGRRRNNPGAPIVTHSLKIKPHTPQGTKAKVL